MKPNITNIDCDGALCKRTGLNSLKYSQYPIILTDRSVNAQDCWVSRLNPTYANPYPSSPLQAALDDSQQSSTTFIRDNSTITHNSILEQSSTLNPKTAYRMEEVGIFEDRAANVGAIDVSPFQIGTGKIATHPRIPEIAIAQVGIGKVGMGEVSTKENSSRQIDSAQIGFLRKTDLDKISFSSSISFDQFLNGNIWREVKTSEFVPDGSEDIFSKPRPLTLKPELPSALIFSGIDVNPIHNNVSNLLTNIYSTAQSIWHTTAPIDLTFDITNLPTGQLAEATITGYDQLGRPNTATISIDDDANGVGWFIDTTPGDSSWGRWVERLNPTYSPMCLLSRIGKG
jgi:hypothetical protein